MNIDYKLQIITHHFYDDQTNQFTNTSKVNISLETSNHTNFNKIPEQDIEGKCYVLPSEELKKVSEKLLKKAELLQGDDTIIVDKTREKLPLMILADTLKRY
ncbi:hypothetical protein MKL29_10280 [Streptococcus suis]|nr:hypothetical protein [Streptococcus suis]